MVKNCLLSTVCIFLLLISEIEFSVQRSMNIITFYDDEKSVRLPSFPLLGGFVFPHGAIILDPDVRDLTQEPAYLPTTRENCLKLHAAMREQAEALVELNPDVILMTTPHGLRLDQSHVFSGNHEVSGSAEWDGKWKEFTATLPIEMNLTAKIVKHLQQNDNPVEMAIIGLVKGIYETAEFINIIHGRSPESNKLPIQWGEAIPLWFINEAYKARNKTMPQSMLMGISSRVPRTEATFSELLKLGHDIWTFIKTELKDRRVIIVTSGDLSHAHSTNSTSPYPFHPDAQLFDGIMGEWAKVAIDKTQVSQNSTSNTFLLKEGGRLVDHILSCGHTGLIVLQGILTSCAGDEDETIANNFRATLLANEWPTYYGMMVNHFIAI